MTNIPRRQIYETMLEYEEYLLELQILLRNENNFKKYFTEYKDSYQNLIKTYKKINALFVLFFENKKYENQSDLENDLNYYLKEEKETNKILKTSKNFKKDFLELLEKLEETFTQINKIENLNQGREIFTYLDKYNSYIPEILELRRDLMM